MLSLFSHDGKMGGLALALWGNAQGLCGAGETAAPVAKREPFPECHDERKVGVMMTNHDDEKTKP